MKYVSSAKKYLKDIGGISFNIKGAGEKISEIPESP
jgi:hypothetical protein